MEKTEDPHYYSAAEMAAIAEGIDMARVHINWGACRDWHDARRRLGCLGVTLWGNFCDVEGDPQGLVDQLKARGFTVRVTTYNHGEPYLALGDQD